VDRTIDVVREAASRGNYEATLHLQLGWNGGEPNTPAVSRRSHSSFAFLYHRPNSGPSVESQPSPSWLPASDAQRSQPGAGLTRWLMGLSTRIGCVDREVYERSRRE